MPRLGVYIHWPFCRSKCPYCDFFSRVKKDVDQAAIVDGYLADLEYYRGLNDGYTVDSVFFGGGTPSLLEPKQIARILDKIAAQASPNSRKFRSKPTPTPIARGCLPICAPPASTGFLSAFRP